MTSAIASAPPPAPVSAPSYVRTGQADGGIINPLEKLTPEQQDFLENLTGRTIAEGHWEPPGPLGREIEDFVLSILWDVAVGRPNDLSREYFETLIERHKGNPAVDIPPHIMDLVMKALGRLDEGKAEYVPGEPLDIRA